jgi:hypothetical protein
VKFTLDGVQHEFDEGNMTFAEGRAIEKVVGVPFGKVGELARDASLLAIQAMVWVAMKRKQPDLRFADLDDREFGDFDFADEVEEDPGPTPAAIEAASSSTAEASATAAESPTTSTSDPGNTTS